MDKNSQNFPSIIGAKSRHGLCQSRPSRRQKKGRVNKVKERHLWGAEGLLDSLRSAAGLPPPPGLDPVDLGHSPSGEGKRTRALQSLAGGTEVPHTGRNTRLRDRYCREAYDGVGRLTTSLRRAVLRVMPGIEAYPKRHVYVAADDLDRPCVVAALLSAILAGVYSYIHFGTPCTTWGNLARLNGGTRTRLPMWPPG